MTNKSLQEEIEILNKKILQLNNDIIESQKNKTTFISLVANQLNNPMSVILGLFGHLEILENEKNKELFDLIYEEVLNLDFKIQNLLSATMLESGDVENSTALTNLQDIIDEVLESLKYSAKSKNIKIVIKNNVDKKIVINSKNIYIILRNLISNSFLHGFANSEVKIKLDIKESILTISVQNKGDMAKFKNKDDIFTRFGSNIDQEHGFGIGLSVVKALLLTQGGDIDYFYENGTVTFVLSMPINETDYESRAIGSNEFFFENNGFIEL